MPMDAATNERVRQVTKLLHERQTELAKAYHWKAENIVRFFDFLGMTKEQKEDFLAKELAMAYMHGERGIQDLIDATNAENKPSIHRIAEVTEAVKRIEES